MGVPVPSLSAHSVWTNWEEYEVFFPSDPSLTTGGNAPVVLLGRISISTHRLTGVHTTPFDCLLYSDKDSKKTTLTHFTQILRLVLSRLPPAPDRPQSPTIPCSRSLISGRVPPTPAG